MQWPTSEGVASTERRGIKVRYFLYRNTNAAEPKLCLNELMGLAADKRKIRSCSDMLQAPPPL